MHITRSLTACALLTVWLLPSCQLTSSPPESETAPADWTPLTSEALATSRKDISFSTHVGPVLQAKCLACHSGQTAIAGYSLENRERAFAAGPAGPRIVPHRPEQSRLISNVSATHASLDVMPPVGDRLLKVEKKILQRWIEQGAVWPAGPEGTLTPPR
jgi:hypothetical protein